MKYRIVKNHWGLYDAQERGWFLSWISLSEAYYETQEQAMKAIETYKKNQREKGVVWEGE